MSLKIEGAPVHLVIELRLQSKPSNPTGAGDIEFLVCCELFFLRVTYSLTVKGLSWSELYGGRAKIVKLGILFPNQQKIFFLKK